MCLKTLSHDCASVLSSLKSPCFCLTPVRREIVTASKHLKPRLRECSPFKITTADVLIISLCQMYVFKKVHPAKTAAVKTLIRIQNKSSASWTSRWEERRCLRRCWFGWRVPQNLCDHAARCRKVRRRDGMKLCAWQLVNLFKQYFVSLLRQYTARQNSRLVSPDESWRLDHRTTTERPLIRKCSVYLLIRKRERNKVLWQHGDGVLLLTTSTCRYNKRHLQLTVKQNNRRKKKKKKRKKSDRSGVPSHTS